MSFHLYIMRHAKSDWSSPGLTDFDRPLNARGQKAAPRMGEWCAQNGLIPQRIICSAARRTRQTLAALLDHFPTDMDIHISRKLYETEAHGYLEAIREGGDAETLMLIGHNPSIHEVAGLLAARGDENLLSKLHQHYPTGAISVIDLDAARFADCAPGGGYLAGFMVPRELET